MATSMRFLNVRNSLNNFTSYRFSSFINNRTTVKCYSDKTTSISLQPNNEDSDDFFGIAENFKLQHFRHVSQPQQQEVPTSISSVQVNAETNEHSSNVSSELNHQNTVNSYTVNTLKRRDRRMTRATSFDTSFGAITLDSSQTSGMNMEDLATKTREILAKLSQEILKPTISPIDKHFKQEDLQKNPKETSKCVEKKSNFTKINRTSRRTDSINSPQHTRNNSSATTNYFDEIYFPENSIDKNSHISLNQTSKVQSSVYVENSSIMDCTQNLDVHKSLSAKMNIAEEPRIVEATWKHRQWPSEYSANLMDEQYFSAALNDNGSKTEQSIPTHKNNSVSMSSLHFETGRESWQQSVDHKEKSVMLNEQSSDFNEVDQQYFGNKLQNMNLQKDIINEDNPSTLHEIKDYTNQPKLNRSDNKILLSDTEHLKCDSRSFNEVSGKVEQNTHHPQLNMKYVDAQNTNLLDEQGHNEKCLNETSKYKKLNTEDHVLSNEDFLKMRKRKDRQTNLDKPETAYDVAMKIRNDIRHVSKIEEKTSVEAEYFSQTTDEEMVTESGRRLDSKGYRLLDNQVPDLDKMTSTDIVRMLKSKIIFDHEDFLAIDKPYGFPCISQHQDRVSITELLPAFAKHLPQSYKVSDLHLVQGLDRDVTGAIILAKNPEIAYMLRGMYKNNDLIVQKYWTITKGVPSHPAGIIDIPIGEAKVGDNYKMVLRPQFMKSEKQIGHASKAPSQKAITHYNVLGSHLQSALVECTPVTNVKHQIRLHLASGLNTPILGDHRYSNFSKLAPQKLHRDMLELLKIRQSSMRKMALHLHCRSIILKDYKGRMIFLTTYPPSHFRDNLKRLGIPKPKM